MQQWMIYGANGYSARLITELAKKAGHQPLLAGRNAQTIAAIGKEENLPTRAFSLDNPLQAETQLKGVALVLNCAGPFSRTAKPMLEACMRTGTHYLDITGEIDVFEMIHGRSAEIATAGVTAIPGVGFDVVPSDCLASLLHEALPNAQSLKLAFHPEDGQFSPGTMKTMVEGMGDGGRVRSGGKIKRVPNAYRVLEIPFTNNQRITCTTIPWGDVSTAFYSTGIPNIEVYTSISEKRLRSLKMMRYTGWLFAIPPVQTFAKKLIERTIKGPNAEERARGRTLFWGEARAADGNTVTLRMQTPEGYSLTAESALKSVEHCLRERPRPGALTPSAAFGAGFVKTLTGVTMLNEAE